MMSTFRAASVLAVSAVLLLSACDTSSPKEETFEVTYDPPFVPSEFQTEVTNPYFPLPVGATWTFEGESEDGTEEIVVEVMPQTNTVAGIEARVVRDRVYLEGELIEDTFDWYAQDADGNVWYLGEETAEYENGEIVTTAGSWEAGVDGAIAGVIMPATPTPGQSYYQEFYEDEAEDRGRVLSTDETVEVPAGTFTNCIKTEDTTPLEPDVLEHKYYCPGVGTTLEEDFEEDSQFRLVEYSIPD